MPDQPNLNLDATNQSLYLQWPYNRRPYDCPEVRSLLQTVISNIKLTQSQTLTGAQKPLTSRSDFKKSNVSNPSNTAPKVSAAQVHFNEDIDEFPINPLRNPNVVLSAEGGIQTMSLSIDPASLPDADQEDTHNNWCSEQQHQLNEYTFDFQAAAQADQQAYNLYTKQLQHEG
ncbi:hypothetical protein DFH28DRAFT_922515 [Melampsora americana]|nr:hypothetical protein DFH28DRAFT_922515 [Melampsora americana]